MIHPEIAKEARFNHLSHHPAELEQLSPAEVKGIESSASPLEWLHKDESIAVALPHSRVAHITGLRVPARKSSLVKLVVHRTDLEHPIQDGAIRVTQQIAGRTVGGLLYLLRAERTVDAAATETD